MVFPKNFTFSRSSRPHNRFLAESCCIRTFARFHGMVPKCRPPTNGMFWPSSKKAPCPAIGSWISRCGVLVRYNAHSVDLRDCTYHPNEGLIREHTVYYDPKEFGAWGRKNSVLPAPETVETVLSIFNITEVLADRPSRDDVDEIRELGGHRYIKREQSYYRLHETRDLAESFRVVIHQLLPKGSMTIRPEEKAYLDSFWIRDHEYGLIKADIAVTDIEEVFNMACRFSCKPIPEGTQQTWREDNKENFILPPCVHVFADRPSKIELYEQKSRHGLLFSQSARTM